MPLYLGEADVEALLGPADAVEAVEACFARMARGVVDARPRLRLALDPGLLNVMAGADRELGVAGLKAYATVEGRRRPLVMLYDSGSGELVALVEAERLGRLRTGAASAVAARHLARTGARTLGVIGAGRQAETQIACIRAALPGIEEVVVYARTAERLAEFCRRASASPAGYNREVAEQDVVVTITTSRDPVLRGEWLKPGALVCAVGANRIEARELDNAALERAAFVCCDWKEQAQVEAGDLAEPVERGVLDWLEVHELAEVVSGNVVGRAAEGDVIIFKSVGIAATDLAVAKLAVDRALERGLGSRV